MCGNCQGHLYQQSSASLPVYVCTAPARLFSPPNLIADSKKQTENSRDPNPEPMSIPLIDQNANLLHHL